MLVEVIEDGPEGICAREMRIAGTVLDEVDVKRSALLREISLLEGHSDIGISSEDFQLWKTFYACVPRSVQELVTVVRVRRNPDDLIDFRLKKAQYHSVVTIHLLMRSHDVDNMRSDATCLGSAIQAQSQRSCSQETVMRVMVRCWGPITARLSTTRLATRLEASQLQ